MEAIDQMVATVVNHLGSAAQSGAVAGAPIKLGEITLVVLSTISIGMGAAGGEGEGKDKKASPSGGVGEGAGGAAKVRPAAVIAFLKDEVKVLPIPDQPGVFDKALDRVPDVVEMVEKVRASFEGPAN